MKLGIVALLGGMLAIVVARCAAEPACAGVTVGASVKVAEAAITLADLLAGATCPAVREAAAQVRLGMAPRNGSVRVFDGAQVRALVEALTSKSGDAEPASQTRIAMQIPERVVVQRAGAMKTCAEIAQSLASSAWSRDNNRDNNKVPSRGREHLDCAAARGVPEGAQLELIRTNWDETLSRWEFFLRCVQPEACVPFTVWARRGENGEGATRRIEAAVSEKSMLYGNALLVKPGQTVSLSWEQGGIRVILPVTCLEAGGLGQLVRVRLKNVARTLRAEVMSDGTVQVRL